MEPVPGYIAEWLDELVWPDPGTDGNTTLSQEQLGRVDAVLRALVSYIETQVISCRKID